MKVNFIAAARQELDGAIRHYNGKRSGLGEEFRAEVDAALDRIEFWPECLVERHTGRARLQNEAIPLWHRVFGRAG